MLELILIYFVGKKFYDLSEIHNQNKWLFAVLGVLCYFVAAFIFGLIIGIIDAAFGIGIDWDNAILMTLIGLPIGLLACYGFYSILSRKWTKEDERNKKEIDDIGKDLDNVRGFK